MKLSEQQAQVMFRVLENACRVHGGVAGFTHEYLVKLTEDIYNQQSTKLVELEKVEKGKNHETSNRRNAAGA